jgi:hypothetical protein
MSVHIPSLVGAPFTESSHTKKQIGTTVQKSLQAVDSSVVQNQVPMFQMDTTNEVPPSKQQSGIPLSMRGMPTQGLGLAGPPPSNMMAGQIPPKPLSAAPAPVLGTPGASMTTGKPGGTGSLVLKKEQLSIPIPKNSPVAGTLRIEIPYQNNKPLFKRIKDVIFVPSSSATPTAAAAPKPPMAVAAPKPPMAVAAPKPPMAVAAPNPPMAVAAPKPPMAVAPRRKRGRMVVLGRGKAVKTYPDGRRVIMKRGRFGRMVTTTIKPNGVRVIQQGRRTVLIQPNGQRVITKRGPFGGVTVVTVKPDGTRIVEKGGKKVILKRR